MGGPPPGQFSYSLNMADVTLRGLLVLSSEIFQNLTGVVCGRMVPIGSYIWMFSPGWWTIWEGLGGVALLEEVYHWGGF